MFGNVEHIGIAVKDISKSIPLFEKLSGSKCYKQEKVDSEGVVTAFFRVGDTKIELLQAIHEDSPIAKFVQKRGEGIHHIAYGVDNIESEMKRLKNSEYRLLSELPKEGADNKMVCFLHPKDTGGVLVELCQDKLSK